MSSAQPAALTPPVALAPSKDVIKEDVHKYRRRFIGPILATALHQSERPKKQKRRHRFLASHPESSSSSDDDSDSSSLSDVIHRHALEFFLKHGGKRENWGESQQKSVRVEMRRRWRESEWGRVHKARRQGATAPKWVGNSFDVGVFLGVDVLDEDLPDDPVSEAPLDGPAAAVQHHPPISVAPSTEAETFVTAVSHPQSTFPPPSSPDPSRGMDASSPHSTNSSTVLLAGTCSVMPQAAGPDKPMEEPGPSSRPEVSFSERHLNGTPDIPNPEATPKPNKGKDKEVRFEPETPAPPREVLARKGSAVKTTSAGAVEQKTSEASVKWGDVIMRGMTAFVVFSKAQ